MTDEKEPNVEQMDEREEALLGALVLMAGQTLSPDEVMATLVQSDVYRSIAAVLLEEEGSETALHYLRGYARVGIDLLAEGLEMDPREERMHERILATLKRVGAEPLTTAEVEATKAMATQAMTYSDAAFPEGAKRPD